LYPARKFLLGWSEDLEADSSDCPMTEALLKDLIQAIESTGIEVWVVTCDGGSTNLAALKLARSQHRSSFISQSGRLKLTDLYFL